ncbi:electron transport complex subunit RsxG [Psychromonas sp. PT13]|uniref:electron transport complex subunit RsxG n=1 Tax=Psychromonas sp. PT13 TaxID=3439547 RepID=UPI003EBFC19E
MITTISRNAVLLAAFAIVCTASVATINLLTRPEIDMQQQRALLKTLDQLIPKTSYDNDIFASCFMVQDDQLLGKGKVQPVFVATKNNLPVALMIETSTFQGYGGEIDLAVGINANGQLTGVQVLKHSETPGLGDKIQSNKSNWLQSFSGKEYQELYPKRWEVKKNGGEFDAFTGATITPRAVVLAVKDALIYFSKNKQSLFNHPADCE